MNIMPMLLCDFYKTVHAEQYPKGLTKLVSYGTPRKSLLKNKNEVVVFGTQYFIMEYLIDGFNEYFFKKPLDKVMKDYNRILENTLGKGAYSDAKIKKLHKLGYLPLEIRALDEGTKCPMGVPTIQISNTHKDFAWVVNSIESLMSCTLWHSMVSASVGSWYRDIVNEYYDISVDDNVPRARALGDFSMRGQSSLESAIKSSAAFCLSFLNTATVPAISFLEEYYDCSCAKGDVVFGSISTEHSVMCSNFAVDGDEITMLKRLLVEIYPNHSFSIVSDSYDYRNFIENIVPKCKEEILNHNGAVLFRGDSGDPVAVVTQTVFDLWKTFGGTINSKGYKVLDSHVKAIYGDSITLQRAEQIYKILIENKFACNNVALGVGSFSMLCMETISPDGTKQYSPYTRDTFGFAVKATYGEIDGVPIEIFKNPIDASWKKSQKGYCIVLKNGETGELNCLECPDMTHAIKKENNELNLLKSIFRDGHMLRKQSLKEIRDLLNGGKF